MRRAAAVQKRQADEVAREVKRAEKEERKLIKAEEVTARKRKGGENNFRGVAEKEAISGRKKGQKREISSIPVDPALQMEELDELVSWPKLGLTPAMVISQIFIHFLPIQRAEKTRPKRVNNHQNHSY